MEIEKDINVWLTASEGRLQPIPRPAARRVNDVVSLQRCVENALDHSGELF